MFSCREKYRATLSKNQIFYGVELQTILRWFIKEKRLKKRLESENRKGSSIVIIVQIEIETSKLCIKGSD